MRNFLRNFHFEKPLNLMRYYFLLIMIFLLACNNTPPSTNDQSDKAFVDCKYGTPQAIFSTDLTQIKQHSFALTKNTGVEEILFADEKQLEIIQTGCNQISQEFRFKWSGDFRDKEAAFWLASAINELYYLGRLSEKYMSFSMWAAAIEEKATNLQLGQFILLEGNFKIKIDKIVSSDQGVLILTLTL